MFYHSDLENYEEILTGIKIKTLAYGEKSLLSEFRMVKGSVLPAHSHPYEQTGYLVEGRLRLRIGDDVQDLEKGSSWCIKDNVIHSAEILEDSVAIEVFSPVREDYVRFKK